jgi:hypothetical protein
MFLSWLYWSLIACVFGGNKFKTFKAPIQSSAVLKTVKLPLFRPAPMVFMSASWSSSYANFELVFEPFLQISRMYSVKAFVCYTQPRKTPTGVRRASQTIKERQGTCGSQDGLSSVMTSKSRVTPSKKSGLGTSVDDDARWAQC